MWVRIGAGSGGLGPEGLGRFRGRESDIQAPPQGGVNDITKSLILAQNERWRRVLSMQVEREPGGNPGGEWRTGE